jgi:hypothetical protein
MSKYLVTVTALADVWTYVQVEADDAREAKEKAVREIQREGAEWKNGEHRPRLLDAIRVERLGRPDHESGGTISAGLEDGFLRAAS